MDALSSLIRAAEANGSLARSQAELNRAVIARLSVLNAVVAALLRSSPPETRNAVADALAALAASASESAAREEIEAAVAQALKDIAGPP